MRNISNAVASMMLLATQATAALPAANAATDTASAESLNRIEVRFNTNTPDAVIVNGPKTPNFDTDVLVPLRASQALAAENARKAAAVAAAKAAAAKKAKLSFNTLVVLPAGSHTDWMAAAGIAASDYDYASYIIDHESGWGVTKSNYGGSGAYGLGQALPASKMAKFGSDYLTNPITQLRWANAYAIGSYGSWANAYNHWIARHVW
jgi:hypothetical protein